ncbi:hypothetical protein BH23ACI1_BH23ACI1_05290 [soil metagenome]
MDRTAHLPSSLIPPGGSLPVRAQRPALLQTALVALLPAVFFLAALAAVTSWKDIPFGTVASDPHTVGDLPFYAGLLSNVGVLLWCAAAAVATFSGAILWARGVERPLATFLLASGVFTAVLLLDDFFLIHEIVFPYYLGLPQNLLLGAYAVGSLAWLGAFRRTILRTESVVLLLALVFLGLSVVFDQLPPMLPMHLLWEDGAKLLGIATWCTYFVRTSAAAIADGAWRQ